MIACGPRRMQRLLRQFFTTDVADYLFSPKTRRRRTACRTNKRKKDAVVSIARRTEQREAREESEAGRGRQVPPGYSHAVARACDRAFPPPGKLAQRKNETYDEWWNGRLNAIQREEVKQWRKETAGNPTSFATRSRRECGSNTDSEAAQVMLGHARADVTQVYAERNEAVAVGIAAKIG